LSNSRGGVLSTSFSKADVVDIVSRWCLALFERFSPLRVSYRGPGPQAFEFPFFLVSRSSSTRPAGVRLPFSPEVECPAPDLPPLLALFLEPCRGCTPPLLNPPATRPISPFRGVPPRDYTWLRSSQQSNRFRGRLGCDFLRRIMLPSFLPGFLLQAFLPPDVRSLPFQTTFGGASPHNAAPSEASFLVSPRVVIVSLKPFPWLFVFKDVPSLP